jgi:hypothetical protein
MNKGSTRGLIGSLLLCTLLALTSVPWLKADVTGSILGTATDSSSAVLQGVAVVATNLETNLSQATLTDAVGQYRFLALPAGKYKVEASLAGFQKFLVTGIDLTVNEQHRVDIVMQLGNVSQEVEVNAASVQVETTNSQIGQVVEEKALLALPLNGRSYIDLLGLQPGVAPLASGTISNRPVSGQLSAGNISVNGQRESANAFLVNGGDVSEGRNMGTSIIPNLDSVAEFRLITNSFDAEYGRFSGAIMNAITKSGTNGFHGTAFEFLRNDKLDSRNFFDPAKGAFKRNQFGYAVGGPAIKNKVFWFTDYQGTREVRGVSTGLVEVPTVAMRSGAFPVSAFLDNAGKPATVNGPYWAQVLSDRLGYGVTSGEPYSFNGCSDPMACVFPGGVIPARAFAPTTNPLLKYFPMPNTGANILTSAGLNRTLGDDKAGQRVDILNQKTGNWFIYYVFDDSTATTPFAFGNGIPGFPAVTPARAQQGVLTNTKVFGPTAVNDARVSFTRVATTTNGAVGGFGVKLSSLGFVENTGLGIFPYPEFEALPQLSFNNFAIGPGGVQSEPNNTWHLADNFSKIHGRHTMKFGGDFRYLQINDRNRGANVNGSFGFDGSETGSDFADFLLGAPSRYVQSSIQFLDSRTRYGAVYAQDSFRVKPNLTVNFGLRWEASMPWYDTQDKIETLIPGVQSTQFPTAPLGWLVPGDPTSLNGSGKLTRTLAPTDYKEFGPRIGLAYSPSASEGFLGKILGGPGRTSIRAAYGIYYTATEDLTLFDIVADAPYGQFWVAPQPPLMQEPFRTRSDGSSQGVHFPFIFPVPGSPANKTLDYSIFLPIGGSPGPWYLNRQPYAEHYNVVLQRSLSSNTVMSVGYVATQGHRLLAQVESNPGNANLCLSLRGSGVKAGTAQCGPNGENGTYTRPDGTRVVGTRAPFGNAFTSNSYQMNTGNSTYNSLQASLERRATNFTFLASYTFSKALTNSSGYNQGLNYTNYALSKSLAQFDMTHNFVISYAYELPFVRLGSALPKRLVQGWTLNGITRFTTGFPVNISQSGDRSLVGIPRGSIDQPNFIGPLQIQDPRLPGPRRGNQYFSSSGFTSEVLGGFGNANRAFFHGPGLNNWDFALHKDTTIREGIAIQFRAEFFNLFNHAQFNNPNGNFASSQFGYVSSARDPRIGQMSLKFLW